MAKFLKSAHTPKGRGMAAIPAPLLARWLRVLFWLAVAGTAAHLMSGNLLPELPFPLPVRLLRAWGDGLGAAVMMAWGGVLLVPGRFSRRYRAAGILRLLCGAYLAGALLFEALPDPLPISPVTPFYAAALLAELCLETSAHGAALAGQGSLLSRRWRLLWWGAAALLGLVLVTLLLLFVAPMTVYLLLTLVEFGRLALDLAWAWMLRRTAAVFGAVCDKEKAAE